jgi:hypothetical protein
MQALLCRFCKEGKECTFAHVGTPAKKWEVCRFFMQGQVCSCHCSPFAVADAMRLRRNCAPCCVCAQWRCQSPSPAVCLQCNKGAECPFNHDVPCKWYHVEGTCPYRASCRFSHEELSDAEYDRWVQMEVLPAAITSRSLHTMTSADHPTEPAQAHSAPLALHRPPAQAHSAPLQVAHRPESLSSASDSRGLDGALADAARPNEIAHIISAAQAMPPARHLRAGSESDSARSASAAHIDRLTSGTALPEVAAADLLGDF